MNTVNTAHSQPMPPPSQSTIGSPTITMRQIAAIAFARNLRSPEPTRTPSSTNAGPPSGWLMATHTNRKLASDVTAGSSLKRLGSTFWSAKTTTPAAHPKPVPQRKVRRGGELRASGRAPTQRLPDEGLRGDLERVEREREQYPDLHRDLLGGELDLAEARGGSREDEERTPQEEGAQEQEPPVTPRRPDCTAVRPQTGTLRDGRPQDDERIDGRRAHLHHDRRERRGPHAIAEPVDEDELEGKVDHIRDHRDGEWDPHALAAPQVTHASEGDQERWDPQKADAEVHVSECERRALDTDQGQKRIGEHVAEARERNPDREPEPDRLHCGVRGRLAQAGAEEAGDRGGRAHREEDAKRVAGQQHGGRGGDSGELGSPEMTDHRGVGEHVQGLGDQREERRDRQPEDLAIEGVPFEPLHDSTVGSRPWRTR